MIGIASSPLSGGMKPKRVGLEQGTENSRNAGLGKTGTLFSKELQSAISGEILTNSGENASVSTAESYPDYNYITPISADALEQNATAAIDGESKPDAETYEALLDSIWDTLDNLPNQTSATSSLVTGLSDSILTLLLSMNPDMGGGESMGGGLESVLLMLCAMLSNGGNNTGDAMNCIRALIDKLPSDQAAILRSSLMNSDNSYSALDEIDKKAFSSLGMYPQYNSVTSGAGYYPYEAWRKCDPSVVSNIESRTAKLYTDVIEQFNVESNGRYKVNKKGTNDTYCNIFLWDVTSAMNAEIPHYIDKSTKAPRNYPDTQGAMELNANATYDWLMEHGSNYGWVRATAEQAQLYANQGRPAITAKKNPGGIGHVQVVCPSASGGYDPVRGVTVAQAGSRLREYTHITEIYGNNSLSQVEYFVHL